MQFIVEPCTRLSLLCQESRGTRTCMITSSDGRRNWQKAKHQMQYIPCKFKVSTATATDARVTEMLSGCLKCRRHQYLHLLGANSAATAAHFNSSGLQRWTNTGWGASAIKRYPMCGSYRPLHRRQQSRCERHLWSVGQLIHACNLVCANNTCICDLQSYLYMCLIFVTFEYKSRAGS